MTRVAGEKSKGKANRRATQRASALLVLANIKHQESSESVASSGALRRAVLIHQASAYTERRATANPKFILAPNRSTVSRY
jgi:hypothetical protein